MTKDRRRAPRVDVIHPLSGRSAERRTRISVLDLSLGGMAVRSGEAFSVDKAYQFEIALGDGSTVTVRGLVRHCRKVAPQGRGGDYVAGIAFVDDETQRALPKLGYRDPPDSQ